MRKDIRTYKVNGKQFAYVLDSINVTDGDGNTIENASDKDRVQFFFDTFDEEYNYPYNRKIYPSLQDRITQYLKGLPSCINIAFSYYDIAEIGKMWGYCQTERKEYEFKINWFNRIAFRLIQLKAYFNL